MGRWDRELVELLPESVKVYASAGAGFDWIDTACLADYGELDSRNQALGVAEPGKHWRVFRDTLLGLFDWMQTFVSLGELIFLQEPCIFSFDYGLFLAFISSSCRPLMRFKELEKNIEKLTKRSRL